MVRAVPALLCVLLLASTAGAQPYHFGKNKVQHDEFDWQRLETDHFDVYFYPEEEELASIAARMAEEGFRELERRLAHTVRRRVPLIVYSSHVYFEQTNIMPIMLPEGVAGFTEFLKGRVALPLSGSYPEFERVLHHELVHVFMFDRIRTVLRDRGTTDIWFGPLWFSEGLAEYLSGPQDTQAHMILRDALFSGRLAPIAQMHRIHGTFQMYKEGESICHLMAERYGEDVFARLLDNWWRGEDFHRVFEATTGEPLSELDAAWVYRLQKEYLPDIEEGDPPGRLAEALTHTGFNLKAAVIPPRRGPELPPDSVSFVFFRNDQGYTTIARSRLGGGGPRPVMAGEREPEYESLHPLQTSLDVSPDGESLAFVAKRNGRDHLILWDLEEGRRRRRFTFDELVALSSPSWSPGGDRLAFAGARRNGSTDLFLLDLATGALTPLTDDLCLDRDPDWHPRLDLLVFSSDRASGPEAGGWQHLFALSLDTGEVTPLTSGEHKDLQPAWSPEGDRIAFSSDRRGYFDLYSLNLRSGAGGPEPVSRKRLTRALTGLFDPAWTPDGKELLLTGFEGGGFQIYRLGLDAAAPDSAAVAPPPLEGPWTLAGLPDRGAVSRRSYKRRLSLDVAQSQISQDPVFGTSGGVQVGLSDILGDERYYFILSHISGSRSGILDGLNFLLGRQHLARQLNIDWGLFHLNDRLSGRFGRAVREKRSGGWVELSYPFNRHDRIETRLTARHADIDRQFEGRQLTGWLVSNHITFTHDNSLWIPTGPMEGSRFSLGAGQTIDFKSSRPFNTTFYGDYRHYLRLSRRTSLAVRYMGRHSRGDVPEYFSMGGSWTLRGYGFRSLWGSNLLLLNHEIRYPLLDRFVLGFPFGRIAFSALRGALFVDAGNAWNDGFGDWKGSLGLGARIGLGGFFVFRLDASRRTDFTSVDGETRWDFFFGWDY